MIRDVSFTLEAITIEETEDPFKLDHATLIKTLKNLLDDGIKPTM